MMWKKTVVAAILIILVLLTGACTIFDTKNSQSEGVAEADTKAADLQTGDDSEESGDEKTKNGDDQGGTKG